MKYQYIELILEHRNNWVYRRECTAEQTHRANSAERIATSRTGLYSELARLGAQGWQVSQMLESESKPFGRHRIYLLVQAS